MSSPGDKDRRNYLRISSATFSLELEGDPSFILETYDNVRQDILRRLIDLIRNAQDAQPDEPPTLSEPVAPVEVDLAAPPVAGPQRATPVAMAGERGTPESARVRAANATNYVWVYITHEIYNKVYVVDLDGFMTSPFSRFLDGRRLRKLYISRDHQEVLGPLLSHGKTLWSELTEKGREQLASTGNNK